MRKKLGITFILLGFLCLLSSVGLVFYNQWEAKTAEESSGTLLLDARTIIAEHTQNTPAQEDLTQIPETLPLEMATVELDGYDCIGILTIPVLELELPVLKDWSYEKLRKAPCLYYGSYYTEDFVIAAHNYRSHFGRLSSLQPKDLVLFTSATGEIYCYEVVLLETLPPTATKEMITSGFDLSLYTCTPGGASRVTLRCNRVNN